MVNLAVIVDAKKIDMWPFYNRLLLNITKLSQELFSQYYMNGNKKNERYSLVCIGEFLVLDNKEKKVCFQGDLNQAEAWLDQNENKMGYTMTDPTPEEPKPRRSYATIAAIITIILFCIYMIIRDNNQQAEAEKKAKEAEKVEQTTTEADIPPSLKELSEPPKETTDDTEVVIEKVPKAKS